MTATREAAGRTAALTDSYLAHRDDLLSFARRRLGGNRQIAEEVVQDTFLRAWRSLDRFDARIGSMRMWLFAICRNASADAARIRTRHARGDSTAVTGRHAEGDAMLDRLAATWHVRDALRDLPAGQREAIVEVHLRQRPYADVARDLGVPIGTVKSRIHLGLRAARQALAAA